MIFQTLQSNMLAKEKVVSSLEQNKGKLVDISSQLEERCSKPPQTDDDNDKDLVVEAPVFTSTCTHYCQKVDNITGRWNVCKVTLGERLARCGFIQCCFFMMWSGFWLSTFSEMRCVSD